MHRQFKLSILLAVVAGLTGCAPDMASITEPVAPEATVAAAMNSSEASRVTLIRAVHFPAPGNGDVLVPSGSYTATSWEGARIALIGQDPAQPYILAAESFNHDTKLAVPLAAMQSDDSSQHLALLMPEGKGLEAMGSFTGIQGRGPVSVSSSRLSNLPVQARVFSPPPTPAWIGFNSEYGNNNDPISVGVNRYGSAAVCRGRLAQTPGTLFVGTTDRGGRGCFLAYGKLSDGYEYLAAVWQRALDGAIPTGAYPMGGPQYACRAYYSGGQVPGRIRAGMAGCAIGWKGKEIVVPAYEVLLQSFVTLSGGGTELTYSPEVFKRAVFGGVAPTDDTGTPNENFLCATLYQGEIHPGRLNDRQRTCVVGANGTEKYFNVFSIVQAKLISVGDPGPLVAGKMGQKPLYPCVHHNAQVNETHVGFINPDYANGTNPGTCDFGTPDGVFGRVQSWEAKTIRDLYQSFRPGWDPAVK